MRPSYVIAIGFVVSLEASAVADHRIWRSGARCTFMNAGIAPQSSLIYENGIRNSDPTLALFVMCPIALVSGGQAELDETQVFYQDHNADDDLHPAGGGMEFTAKYVDGSGTSWVGETSYSCATGGGCPVDTDPDYVTPNGYGSQVLLDWSGIVIDSDGSFVVHALIPYSDIQDSGVLGYWTTIVE